MSEKPTKPWHVERTSVYGANGVIVATLGGYTVDDDSALVAAAPELLDACKLTALHFSRASKSGAWLGDDEHDAWTACDEAIAKAEGRSNG